MAEFLPQTGICDYCGGEADERHELNYLSCTFQQCEGGLYHQECLYQFLRSNRLEKNRKTGFKCPRGCGKGTKWPQPCPGRIDKSHPIIPRNEKKRQQALAPAPEPPPKPSKAEKKAADAAKAKAKAEEEKAAKEKAAKEAAAAKTVNGKLAAAATASSSNKPVAVVSTRQPKEKEQLPDKEQLKAAAALARREIGLGQGSSVPSASQMVSSSIREPPASTSYSSLKPTAAPAGTVSLSAWLKPSSELAPPPPPPTLAQLPQLQQLMSKGKSGTLGAGPAAAAAAAAKPAGATGGVAGTGTVRWGTPGAAAGTPAAASGSGTATPSIEAQLDSHQHFPPVSSAAAAAPPAVPAPVGKWAVAAAPTQPAAPAQQQPAQPATPAQAPPSQQQQEPVTAATPAPAGGSTNHLTREASDSLGVQGPGQEAGEGEGSDDEGLWVSGAKLTKAQRKNLKRAEKKRAERGGPTGGSASGSGWGAAADSDPSAQPSEDAASNAEHDNGPADGGPAAAAAAAAQQQQEAQAQAAQAHAQAQAQAQHQAQLQAAAAAAAAQQAAAAAAAAAASGQELEVQLQEECIACLVQRKVSGAYHQLLRLGFREYQAAAGVRACGLGLDAAIEWLLDRASDTPQQLATNAGGLPLPNIDIMQELQQLTEAQPLLGSPPAAAIYSAVINARGDVPSAIRALASAAGLAGPGGMPLNGTYGVGGLSGGHAGGRFSGLSHQPSLESFYSAHSDAALLGSMASGDLGSLEALALQQQHHQRLSYGDASASSLSSLTAWRSGLPSQGGAGGEVDSGAAGAGGSSSRLSAWMRSEEAMHGNGNAGVSSGHRQGSHAAGWANGLGGAAASGLSWGSTGSVDSHAALVRSMGGAAGGMSQQEQEGEGGEALMALLCR